ncbi:hypothetical protein [Streptomyces montanisoli]|uniref:Galactose mutarotase n=1 Tax=Streptomyces montanisoli TaxID=2798581 RepID=A0A940MB28_9ACTN|nr:hypothetical protein [Streptomyces montanisoli]MBP0456755.1 hypothetical protein [Streptomyces montanisoli]
MSDGTRAAGPRIVTDPAHGGRWTSLTSGGREWLWHRDEPRRHTVRPGDPFADAGGAEECLPTVRGVPDHGDAWSRPWRRHGDEEHTAWPGFALARRIRTGTEHTVVDYRLAAEPGTRFLWAAHALLDLSHRATVALRDGAPLRLYPDGGPHWRPGRWPCPAGIPLHLLGAPDGTAVGAVVEAGEATVHDGPDSLTLRVEADGQPLSVALWRNLGGFPEQAPYRSIGVEPMLGRVFALDGAAEGDTATVPPSGQARWRLVLTAHHSQERTH